MSAKTQSFPCPVCAVSLDVRLSKKDKPYVVCNDCGVQMFVRNAEGIGRFQQQLKIGVAGDSVARMRAIEQRYRRKCPKCGKEFWIDPELVQTSWFNGEFIGFRCPVQGCDGVARPNEAKL